MSQNLDPLGGLFQRHYFITSWPTPSHYKSFYSTLVTKLCQNLPDGLNNDAGNLTLPKVSLISIALKNKEAMMLNVKDIFWNVH